MSNLDLSFLPGQLEVLRDSHRFKILVCGRRWGKSVLASRLVIISALKKENGTYFLVSPSYAQTSIIWRMIKRALPREYVRRIMEGEKYIELKNGSLIFAKSGDNADSLRGEGLDGVVLDEAAMLKPEVWNEAIRPALSDKGGWALIITTPKGKNWVFDLFLRGTDDTQAEFKSFSFPSFANPLLPTEEIEEMRRNLPELSFRQEVLAEFIEGGGVVFRNVSNCMVSQREEPISGEYYVVGVDLGRHEDFTVISVGKIRECRQVYMERFNQTDWDYIKDRIRSVHYKYNKGAIIIDSTGYGDPIYEDLGKEGLNITGYHINAASKPKLIENLQIMLENSVIQLLKDKQLELEMNAYTYTLLPSGNVRFEAPKGFHDDCVISVALMAQGFIGQGGGIIGEIQEDDKEQPTDYADMEDATEDEWDELRLNDED